MIKLPSVIACLESTQFMALATQGPEQIWNNAVYFAYDDKLNLYFISEPSSRHMQNLKSDPVVAVAIFSTDQSPQSDVLGLQIRGQAEIVPDHAVKEAHAIYYQRSPVVPGISDKLTDYLGPAAAWKFVKITPLEVGIFDTKTTPSRVTINLEELRSTLRHEMAQSISENQHG